MRLSESTTTVRDTAAASTRRGRGSRTASAAPSVSAPSPRGHCRSSPSTRICTSSTSSIAGRGRHDLGECGAQFDGVELIQPVVHVDDPGRSGLAHVDQLEVGRDRGAEVVAALRRVRTVEERPQHTRRCPTARPASPSAGAVVGPLHRPGRSDSSLRRRRRSPGRLRRRSGSRPECRAANHQAGSRTPRRPSA